MSKTSTSINLDGKKLLGFSQLSSTEFEALTTSKGCKFGKASPKIGAPKPPQPGPGSAP